MSNFTTYVARGTCLTIGAALAAVGMKASYDAAALTGNTYLMVAAPLIALAAPITAIMIEIAADARQYLKALALLMVFGLGSVTVFYTAMERNHDGRAVGEAQRLASRTTAARAERGLAEAKANRAEATAKADKVRGKDTPKATAILLAEKEAKQRVAEAEIAVREASSHAVTDSGVQQADWLMPVTIDVGNMVLIWVGFSLGTIRRKEVPTVVEKVVYVAEPVAVVEPVEVVVEVPVTKAKDPKRVAAGNKGRQTILRKQGKAAGTVVELPRKQA